MPQILSLEGIYLIITTCYKLIHFCIFFKLLYNIIVLLNWRYIYTIINLFSYIYNHIIYHVKFMQKSEDTEP